MSTTRDDDAAELARLRLWVDAAQDLGRLFLWERDMRDGSGRWDRQIFGLYGLPPSGEAPHYTEMLKRLHPDDRDAVSARYQASLGRPGRHDTRFRIVRTDGQVVNVHSIWQVPAQGHQVVGVLIDDTESLTLATEHRAAQAQIGLVSHMVGVSFWRTDLQDRRVYRIAGTWQGAWADPGDRGTPLDELRATVHPDDRDALQRASQSALDGAEAPMAQARFRTPDGDYRTVLTRRVAQRDADGRPVALLGVGLDITDQVRAREQLGELLERQDMIVDVTGVGVWRWTPGTGEREWNDTMRHIYGVPLDGPLPPSGDDGVLPCVLPADRDAVKRSLQQVLSPEAPRVEAAYRIRRPDGTVRHLVGRARRMPGSTEVITGIVIDVTEMQRAEAALRDKAVAEEAARAKNEFLSRVSHELRTPLNAVLGFTGLLLEGSDPPMTERQRGHLQHVWDAGQHLLGLVDDLLHIGQAEPGDDPGTARPCDLSDLIEEAVAWHADRASAAGVQLCISGTCGQVPGGGAAWRQILGHLVSNAIKFNRSGGYVQIAQRAAAEPGWVELEVRDTGIGMSPEQLAHLFEPFNRLGAERRGIPGTGLGLSLVRRMLESLGGSIRVDSRVGAGTRLTLRVPGASESSVAGAAAGDAGQAGARAADAAPAAGAPAGDVARAAEDAAPPTASPEPPPPPPPAPKVDVVCLEDNTINAQLIKAIFARRPGVRLHLATSVADGVEMARRVRPALLLVDMNLPDGSGYDVLEQLAPGDGRPAGGCVALSADAMPHDIERALAAGFDDYWTKPIKVERFLADVDRTLSRSG